MLGPHACFIVCVGCLAAECRRINPETSASPTTHKLDWTRQDRGSTVPACLWERIQQQPRVFPPHLSVCVPPLSQALHLSVFSWQREKGEYVSLFLPLSSSTVLHLLEQVVNQTTTKGTACMNPEWGCRNTER